MDYKTQEAWVRRHCKVAMDVQGPLPTSAYPSEKFPKEGDEYGTDYSGDPQRKNTYGTDYLPSGVYYDAPSRSLMIYTKVGTRSIVLTPEQGQQLFQHVEQSVRKDWFSDTATSSARQIGEKLKEKVRKQHPDEALNLEVDYSEDEGLVIYDPKTEKVYIQLSPAELATQYGIVNPKTPDKMMPKPQQWVAPKRKDTE
jgi:hypothetical protein